MNPRIRNEIRSLAPVVIGVMALQLLVHMIGGASMATFMHGPVVDQLTGRTSLEVVSITGQISEQPLRVLILATGCVLIGLLVFGRDITTGVMSQLMSQPATRVSLWNEKLFIGFIATSIILSEFLLLSGTAIMADARELYSPIFGPDGPRSISATSLVIPVAVIGVLTALFAIGAGTCFTILTRNVTASFWMVLSTGMAVLLIIQLCFSGAYTSRYEGWAQSLLFAMLGASGIWLARHQFLRMEDVAPLSGILNLSFRMSSAESHSGAAETTRRRSPVAALIRKELGLQQVNLIFLCVAWLIIAVAAGVTYLSAPDQINFGVQLSPWWSIVALAKGICCITPFLIGATAFAEENRFGTTQWHLTMPASFRLQWIVKVGTAVVLGLITGGFLFFAVDALSGSMAGKPVTIILPDDGDAQSALAKFGIYFVVPVVSALIGLYASYFASNFLQSLSLSALVVGSVTAFWFLLEWGFIMPRSTMTFGAVLAVLGPLLLFASYRNFTGAYPISRCLRRNIIGLSGILAMTAITCGVTRNHAWELITVPSPSDEEFAQTVGTKKPVIVGRFGTAAALGPDGSIWWIGQDLSLPFHEEPEIINSPQRVGSETNWVQVVPMVHGMLALREDGTLWRIGQNGFYNPGSHATTNETFHTRGQGHTDRLIPFGTDRRWRKVSSQGWYNDRISGISVDGLLCDVPTGNPLDGATNWVDITSMGGACIGLKPDGSLWFSGRTNELSVRLGIMGDECADSVEFQEFYSDPELIAIEAIESYHYLVASRRDGSKIIWGTPEDRSRQGVILPNTVDYSRQSGGYREDLLTVILKESGEPESIEHRSVFDKRTARYLPQQISVESRWPGNGWVQMEGLNVGTLGLTRDGTLWISGFDLDDGHLLRYLRDRLVTPALHPSPRPRPIGRLVAPENLSGGERN